ncbi:MAG: penicillin-binding protein activator [Rhodobacteraceae bacterium]|nr:penicillin-binding protein activator [Paracoccaceae bacterium]
MTIPLTLADTIVRSFPSRRNLAAALAGVFFLAACSGGSAPPPAPANRAPATPAAATTADTQPPSQLVAGRDGMSPAPDPAGLDRIALLVPLTGPSSAIGQGLLNAAQMALFDAADDKFVLQVYDTRGTPDGAAEAAALAVSHGARLILGPLFAAEAKAVAPQADAAGVKAISFSTDPSVAGGSVYVMGFLVSEQVRAMVDYAASRGLSRIAVLAPNTVYGQSVTDTLTTALPEVGAQLTRVAYFDPTGSDLEDVVRRLADFDRRRDALERQRAELAARGDDEVSQLALKRLERLETTGDVEFDAVFIPEQGARLAQAASLLSLFDVEPGRVQLLGTMLWNTPGLGREPALIGAVYPAPDPVANRDFAMRYRQVYNANPPPLATHGYDAAALAAVLARSDAAMPFGADAVTNPVGFAGVDGIFRLGTDGLAQRGFAIMQISRDGADVIRPAPTTFAPAQVSLARP